MNVNDRPERYEFKKIRRFSTHPRVYVAGPYRAPTPDQTRVNIETARAAALRVVNLGGFPVTPHLLCGMFDYDIPDARLDQLGLGGHRFWLDGLLDLLLYCDCVLVFDNVNYSAGTEAEVELAHIHGIPVFYTAAELTQFINKRKVK